jgi:DNA-binding IclR family transcriptional regulator
MCGVGVNKNKAISMVSLNETTLSGANHGQTISRAAAVLRALARGDQGRRLTDVALDVGLTKPTVLRLLRALEGEGLAFMDANGAWRLGLGLVTLGAAAANREGLRRLAADALTRVATRTEDTAFFSLREGAEILCVDRQEGPFPIRTLLLAAGQRRPLGVGAAGMAVLAFLDDDDCASTLEAVAPRLKEWPGHTPELLRKRARVARKCGYALNDGQILSAMWAVGVPVRDGAGRVVAALSVAAIAERLQGKRLGEVVGLLLDEAAAVERRFRIDGDAVPVTPRVGPALRQEATRGARKAAGRRRR